jgi:hypothetical protein
MDRQKFQHVRGGRFRQAVVAGGGFFDRGVRWKVRQDAVGAPKTLDTNRVISVVHTLQDVHHHFGKLLTCSDKNQLCAKHYVNDSHLL